MFLLPEASGLVKLTDQKSTKKYCEKSFPNNLSCLKSGSSPFFWWEKESELIGTFLLIFCMAKTRNPLSSQNLTNFKRCDAQWQNSLWFQSRWQVQVPKSYIWTQNTSDMHQLVSLLISPIPKRNGAHMFDFFLFKALLSKLNSMLKEERCAPVFPLSIFLVLFGDFYYFETWLNV